MINAFPVLVEAKQALDEGKQIRAAQLVMSHLRQRPGEPRGLALLGAVALKSGALLQGESFLRHAMARGGPRDELLRSLASCLVQQERPDEALEAYRELVNLDDSGAKTRASIAQILDKLGRTEEARALWQQLVSEFPKRPHLWVSYGQNLRAAGMTPEANKAFRKAIELDPGQGEAWWGLASMKSNSFSEDDVRLMEWTKEQGPDLQNLAPLTFALGRAWHARKDYDTAFRYFEEANRAWAESIKYDPAELTAEIAEDAGLFDAEYLARLPITETRPVPIFIVSLPRSGSTLLEQMLGSHREVEPLGELPYVPALLRAVMEKATQRGRATVPQTIVQLPAEQREELGREYLRRAQLHRATDLPYFVDKLPHNWNNLIFIRHILPNAKFIDVRRGAVSCCFANFSHSFARGHSSSFALEHIGRAYRDYVRLMAHLDEAAPGMVHHVRYEALIETPEPVLRSVLDYLGLPWDAALLRFYETDRNVRTPSAEQVRRPLNREGIGTWIPYRQWLGPLFEALGPLADEELAEADRG